MRGFGITITIIAVLVLIFSMAMDVTVPSGAGRVNNIGLIAEQQRLMMFGGIALIAGLLMAILGGRRTNHPAASQIPLRDERPCPFCAEPIKKAAIKCKHCGSDVEQDQSPPSATGWVVSIPCQAGEDLLKTLAKLKDLSLPVIPSESTIVSIGPYETQREADAVRRRLIAVHYITGRLDFKRE